MSFIEKGNKKFNVIGCHFLIQNIYQWVNLKASGLLVFCNELLSVDLNMFYNRPRTEEKKSLS